MNIKLPIEVVRNIFQRLSNFISRNSTSLNIAEYWRGSSTAFDQIATKNSATIYFVEEEANFKLTTDELAIGQDTYAANLYFFDEGSIMITLVQGVISRYNLSTPYELATAQKQIPELNLFTFVTDGITQFTSGTAVSSDGLHVFVSQDIIGNGARIRRVDLATPFDFSSLTLHPDVFIMPTNPEHITGIYISDNGTKLTYSNQNSPVVVGTIDMSTPYDLTTASVSATNLKFTTLPFEPVWSNGGLTLTYLRGQNYEQVTVSTPYRIDTQTDVQSISRTSIGNTIAGNVDLEDDANRAFSHDGKYFFAFAEVEHKIIKFKTAQPFDFVTRLSNTGEFDLYLGENELSHPYEEPVANENEWSANENIRSSIVHPDASLNPVGLAGSTNPTGKLGILYWGPLSIFNSDGDKILGNIPSKYHPPHPVYFTVSVDDGTSTYMTLGTDGALFLKSARANRIYTMPSTTYPLKS